MEVLVVVLAGMGAVIGWAIQASFRAAPGEVSLAGGDAGQVSLVESADGHVSLETDG